MIPQLGGRKFIVALLALVFSFVLALTNKLSPAFAAVVSACVSAFMGSHMVQDWHGQKPVDR